MEDFSNLTPAQITQRLKETIEAVFWTPDMGVLEMVDGRRIDVATLSAFSKALVLKHDKDNLFLIDLAAAKKELGEDLNGKETDAEIAVMYRDRYAEKRVEIVWMQELVGADLINTVLDLADKVEELTERINALQEIVLNGSKTTMPEIAFLDPDRASAVATKMVYKGLRDYDSISEREQQHLESKMDKLAQEGLLTKTTRKAYNIKERSYKEKKTGE